MCVRHNGWGVWSKVTVTGPPIAWLCAVSFAKYLTSYSPSGALSCRCISPPLIGTLQTTAESTALDVTYHLDVKENATSLDNPILNKKSGYRIIISCVNNVNWEIVR